MKKAPVRASTPAQEEIPQDLKDFQALLEQPNLEPSFLKDKLATYLQRALDNDDGSLWGLLFRFGFEKKLTPMVELGLFSSLKEFLAGARRDNKLKVFMQILEMIEKYIHNGGPGTAADDVEAAYIKTILLEKVGHYKPDNNSDEHDPAANEFEWILNLLMFYGKTLLPDFIREEISPKQPELAYWLYHHQGLRSFLKSEIYDHVLEVACRNNDETMIDYCFKFEPEKKKMNTSNERCPALCIAIDQKNIIRINRLFAGGADVNIIGGEEPNLITPATSAIFTNDLVLVKLVMTREDFDWAQNKPSFLRAAQINLAKCNPAARKQAVEILTFIMDEFRKRARPVLDAQLIYDSTLLAYLISTPECRACAAELIREGMGVFALHKNRGRSPLYWARESHDKALEGQLNEYYKANVKKIAELLLASDPRVCQKPAGSSVCTLVMPMVSEWIDLKGEILICLRDLIENKQTSIRQLRKIQEQIENPESALCQFFALGHGKHFWNAASPWPAQFAPLLECMKSTISANNSFTECASPSKF